MEQFNEKQFNMSNIEEEKERAGFVFPNKMRTFATAFCK